MNPTIPHGVSLLVAIAPVKGLSNGSSPVLKSVWRGAVTAPAQEPRSVGATADETFPAVNTPEWDAMNERRAELIRKNLHEGLTMDERQEYDRLQRISLTALVKALPRPEPDFEELNRLRQQLRASSAPVSE
jgi:hypothetical protein